MNSPETSANAKTLSISGWELPILWMDEDILAVSKPAGLLSIADGYQPDLPYTIGLLQVKYGRLWVVHRLDKETSGVLLTARTPEAHRSLSLQFEQRQTQKTYHALVVGLPAWDTCTADFPLRVNGDRKHRTVIDVQHGKPAQTDLEVIRRYQEGYSLIAAKPHTGYTHQIRAHLAWLGYPIVQDPLYQVPKSSPAYAGITMPDGKRFEGINRHALHAFSLAITHPTTNQPLELTAAYPQDFQIAVNTLHEK